MLELLFMVAAFILELAFIPITLLKDRWAAFSAAAAADKESEAQAPEQEARIGVPRPRRISVFSFWRDVVRDEPEEDALPQSSVPPEGASDTESDDASVQKPPTPQPKRAPAVKPAQSTRNSGGAPASFVPPTALLSPAAASSAKPPVDPKRAEATVRQAQAVHAEVDDAQENVRQRMRARKEQQVSRPVSGSRSVSDGSTTRGRERGTASSTRTGSSGKSGSTTSAAPAGTERSDSSVNPAISSTPPQQAFPTKPNQSHPQNIPQYSYVPAPPPIVISHTQHVSSPQLSPEVQKPLPFSPFAGIPSTAQTPASARFPPQQAPSTAQDPLAGIDIDAYFSTIGSPRGQRAVVDPSHGSSTRAIQRPRPQNLDSEKLANHPAISVEVLKSDTPVETPPSPPSQYLGRPSYNTPTRPQVPGSAPAKTPLAPGGYGWHDNSQRSEAKDADEEDGDEDDEEEEGEDALGPDDSISVRGLRPSGEHRDQAPPPETRPSTIFEFDLLKKQVEEEEAAEARAYAQALATLGITNNNHSNGALGLTAGSIDNSGGANAALRMSVNLPGHFPMSPGFQPKEVAPLPQLQEHVPVAPVRPVPREQPAPAPREQPAPIRNPPPIVEPVHIEPRSRQEPQYHQRNTSASAPQVNELKKAVEENLGGGIKPFIPPSAVSNAGTVKPPPPASTIIRSHKESKPPTVQANPRLVQAKVEPTPQPVPKPQSQRNSSGSQRQRSQPPTSYSYQRNGSGPDSIQAMTEQFVETISPPMVSGSLPRSYERTTGMRSQTPVTANTPDLAGVSRYQPPPTAPAVPMKMPMPQPQPQPQHQRTRSDVPNRPGPAVTSRRVGSTGSNSPSVSGSSEAPSQARVTRTKAPVVAQKRSSEYLDERMDGSSLRVRNTSNAPSDEGNKKRRVAPPVPVPPSATLRTRSSAQQMPREGARSASGSSASEVIAHTRTRSAAEGMPSSSNRTVTQPIEIPQPRRPRPRNAP